MLEHALVWERELFLVINGWHTPVLDRLMPFYTHMWVWVPFFLIFVCYLTVDKSRKEWMPAVIAFLIVVIASNITTGLLVKPFFQRLRPTFHPDFMHEVKTVFEYVGEGKYGFISGHSTFSFAVAMFTTLLMRYKPYGWMIFGWASVVVYSRLYLGVHFLTDVIPGMLTGMFIGWAVYRLYGFYLCKKESAERKEYPFPSADFRKKQLTVVLSCYILLILLIGIFRG